MNLNRRNFLLGSAASAAIAGCTTAKAAPRTLAKGEKANVAIIGLGIQGRTALLPQFLNQYDRGAQVTVCCDCDKVRREDGAKRVDDYYKKNKKNVPPCKAVADFRDVLKDPMVDMVCIATPDHWHAYMAVEAMKAGKDVYCEKPLTSTVFEGRAMVNAQKGSGRVVQVGLNRRGSGAYRKLKALIDSGKYGTFRVGRAARVSNLFPNGIGKCPPCRPPAGFDWDKWLGPRPWREYKYTTAPYFFRWHEEFSSQMGNWGVHYMDAMRWMMDETAPCAITAVGGKYFLDHDATIPDTMEVTYEFPDRKHIHFMIYEGGSARPIHRREAEFIGSDGCIYSDERGFDIAAHKNRREFNNPKQPVFKDVNYVHDEARLDDGSSGSSTTTLIRDFLDRVKDRGEVLCPLEEGHRSTCFAHLANIALRVGQRLEWDAKAERFTNCEEANKLLHYSYRDGYSLG